MTSPSIRRQREYDRQIPIPQPNLVGPVNMGPMAAAGPYAPVQQRVNWQESLEQGFQPRHVQWLQNHGGQHQRHNERTPVAARPSAPMEGRVNYQESVEQNRGIVTPHQFMGQQERYIDEEQQYMAHLHDIQLQRQRDHDQEALQHQAHLAELQQHQFDVDQQQQIHQQG